MTSRLLKPLAPALALVLACAGDDGEDDSSAMTFPTTFPADDDDDNDDDDTAGDDDDDDDTAGDDDDDDTGDTTAGDGMMTTTGDDGPPMLPTCQHQCVAPADCNIGGEETGLGCNAGLCSFTCTTDMECIAALSGWNLVPCSDDGDCSGGVCVDTGGGVGGCSLQPSQGACSEANLVEMQAMQLGGGMTTVCGQPNGQCAPFAMQNICIVGCAGQPCATGLTCEADGLCHCEFDTQCVDAGTGNNCNAEGLCEFTCSTPMDCPGHPFDGGTLVCQ